MKKKRAILTIASIAWGTVAILLLLAFGNGLSHQMMENSQAMGRNISIIWAGQTSKSFKGLPPGRALTLADDLPAYLRKRLAGAATVMGEIEKGRVPLTYGKTTINGEIIGEDWLYRTWRNQVPATGGRFFDVSDEKEERRVIFLGDSVAKDIFKQEAPVGKTLLVNNMPFLVIGVLKHRIQDNSYHSPDDTLSFIPRTTFEAMFGHQNLDNLVLGVTHASGMKEAVWRTRQVLGAKMGFDPTDSRALSIWNTVDDNKEEAAIFLGIEIFMGVIGTLTLIVGGVGVANIMYAVVKERTREIGVKMALGARPGWITGPFVLEAFLYTLLGGLFGIFLSILLILLLGLIPTGSSEVMGYLGHPTLSIPIGVITTVILGTIGLAAGYFPARRAAAIDPAETLRDE